MKRQHTEIENTETQLPPSSHLVPENIGDVTKENFDEALEKIKELLPQCDFIALDEEMTGIHLPDMTISYEDTPQMRYQKMRSVVNTFSTWQYGFCLFHRVEGGYVASPFNIWATPIAWHGSDPQVTFSASALEFKRNNHVDLNKWLYHSVNFVNKPTEEKIYAQFFPPNTPETPRKERKPPEFKETEIEIIREILSEIQIWLKTNQEEFEINENKFLSRGIRMNSYFRRNLLDVIEKEFSRVITEVRQVPGQQPWVVRSFVLNLTEEQKRKREEEKLFQKKKAFDSKIGVRRLFTLLVSHPCPLIVHNGLYDLMFLLHHLDTPLPDTLEAFNNLLHTYFPQVYDTKFIYSFLPQLDYVGETSLEDLYMNVCKKQNKEVPLAKGFERYKSGSFLHEAGYDAYLTGSIFTTLITPNIEIKKHSNKLYLMKSIYIWKLDGECETVGKSIHCSFPSDLVTSDFEKLLGNFPGYKIIWINNTSAFLVYEHSTIMQWEVLLEVLNENGKIAAVSWK